MGGRCALDLGGGGHGAKDDNSAESAKRAFRAQGPADVHHQTRPSVDRPAVGSAGMGKQWGVQVEPRCGHEVEAIEGQLQPLPASLAGGDGAYKP